MNTKMKVLIADDSEEFGKACKRELDKAGFDTFICQKDGFKVISLLKSTKFDIVLMDVFMPNADGADILEDISENPVEKPIVLLLSSVDNAEFEEQMIKAGADYYFLKPVSPKSVSKRIERISVWKSDKKSKVQFRLPI
ncbi:MAG: response regulator [Clostridiales bacterium]|nr:response regulator [Clostridiales bacterium]